MAWCEQSCICSRLFASAANRTAGLAVSSSVLARHIEQSKEAAECGCLARKAQACSEALLHNMAVPDDEMPQLCANLCCLLWITAARE